LSCAVAYQLFGTDGNNAIEIPDCGHLSMLEKPKIVGNKIAAILQQHESLDLPLFDYQPSK
jgi:pimeloyl-ACP methyl ester carboxylesterase